MRQGFAIYLPRYLKRRRHARRVEIVPAPLFPRYLFVASTWRRSAGVRSSRRSASRSSSATATSPAAVPAAVVAELQQARRRQGFCPARSRPQVSRPATRFASSTACSPTSLGLFEGMADRERVAILLDLLGRKVRVVSWIGRRRRGLTANRARRGRPWFRQTG